MTPYTANSIKILDDADIIDRFDWARAGEWARLYHYPLDWCQRALEACRRANVDPEYIEARYLRREPIERIPAVDEAMRDILSEARL